MSLRYKDLLLKAPHHKDVLEWSSTHS